MKILVLNSGSSSQKSSLYCLRDPIPDVPAKPEWEGKIEWHGREAEMKIVTASGVSTKAHLRVSSRVEATQQLLETIWSGDAPVINRASEINVIGHRIVNGGAKYKEPVIIDAEVKSAIERASVFAPLHNRAELEGIAIIDRQIPHAPQVAVFDTGFHRNLPEPALVYPGPHEWLAKGIRRYGFHGINHQYCAERAAKILRKELRSLKLVTCHLGSGCSLAAIRDGHSIDTTMGFTPLEGLMMGTRSGSVDPGILTYLMRQEKLTADQLDQLLNEKSGLLGISGLSSDMREIVTKMKDGHARAQLAFDMFVHRLRSAIGAMIAVLGGIDALVFTAGIGEKSGEVRAAACETLAFAGVHCEAVKNAQSPLDQDISPADAPVRVLVIRAQEEWAIARVCFHLAQRIRNLE
jgi:acetate kinase